MKTALVSGASRGIGRAIALKLAAEKWNLKLVSRSAEELEALKKEVEQLGIKAECFVCDITNEEQVNSCFNESLASREKIDLLVLNAGVGKFGPFAESNVSDWDAMMTTNARGSYLLCKLFVPLMTAAGEGQIVFIASDAARRTFPNGVSYCSSKFAQYALAAALRQELRPAGVRVSVIMPGLVASTFNNGKPDAPEKRDWLRPSDVADVVAYIANVPKHVLVDEITLHPLCQDV